MTHAFANQLAVLNGHSIGNLFLGLVYGAVFISVLKKILRKKDARNFFSLAVALFLLYLAVNFFTNAFERIWMPPGFEFLWMGFAAVPAFVFLCFRKKQYFILGAEEKASPSAKFDKLKDEFLSVASHELRTPLSVINGFAEILVREKLGPLNDEQKRRVRKILMQGQRLNRIIDDLLDLSRIRSGKIEVRRDVFDVVPVLKACLDDHLIVSEQQKIELIDRIPDVLPDAVGDLERVTQVVVNLLNNALKYTEVGGQVFLKASHDKVKNEILVEVADNGIGVAPEDLPHLFQEFYRASQHQARKYSGSGLGLAIVKQLVEAQGGKAGVKSEGLGKGSSFYFTLPVAKPRKMESAAEKLRPANKETPHEPSAAASPARRG